MQVETINGQAAWPRDRRAIFSWCLYDWGNSAFPTIIGTFIFSVYYARGIYGDETAGAASWAWTWPTERAQKRTINRFFTMNEP